MKKNLLTVFAVVGAITASFAQTFTNGSTGYTVEFNSTKSNPSCLTNSTPNHGGVAFTGGNATNTASDLLLTNDGTLNYALKLNANATITDPTVAPIFFNIYYTNSTPACVAMPSTVGIDMSTNKKVKIRAKADAAGTLVRFYLASNATTGGFPYSTYNTGVGGAYVIKTFTVGTTYADYEIDYTGEADYTAWPDNVSINHYGFTLTVSDVDVYIESIQFGSAVSAGTLETVNDAISIAPNPASDVVNVSLDELSVESGATVKVLNATGAIVYEAPVTSSKFDVNVADFNTGIYMVQVVSGNKVATQKVVVK